MKVRQLDVATAKLRDALAWYRERSPRVAENFWLRVQDVRRSIGLFPCATPLIGQRTRRFVLSCFPYDVVYAMLPNEIVIVAYAHHSRHPQYWKERLSDIRKAPL